MRPICEGILIGVFSGLILGLLQYLAYLWKRRNQVQFIKKIIQDGRCNVLSKAKQNVDDRAFRVAYFNHMCREVKAALDGRTSNMKFEQIRELRQLFFQALEIDGISINQQIHTCFGRLADPSYFRFLKIPELSTKELEMQGVFRDTQTNQL